MIKREQLLLSFRTSSEREAPKYKKFQHYVLFRFQDEQVLADSFILDISSTIP